MCTHHPCPYHHRAPTAGVRAGTGTQYNSCVLTTPAPTTTARPHQESGLGQVLSTTAVYSPPLPLPPPLAHSSSQGWDKYSVQQLCTHHPCPYHLPPTTTGVRAKVGTQYCELSTSQGNAFKTPENYFFIKFLKQKIWKANCSGRQLGGCAGGKWSAASQDRGTKRGVQQDRTRSFQGMQTHVTSHSFCHQIIPSCCLIDLADIKKLP